MVLGQAQFINRNLHDRLAQRIPGELNTMLIFVLDASLVSGSHVIGLKASCSGEELQVKDIQSQVSVCYSLASIENGLLLGQPQKLVHYDPPLID
ncbi:hypothetical protein VNO77_05109 [Canavalia gladiata]|uniref:Uncharacterized protein n=1 Tax=Canavalia gladiata TaxID=3824 RepID=A0AAN9MXR4_CANGL